MTLEVDFSIFGKGHTLVFQKPALGVLTAESKCGGEPAVTVYNAVTGYYGGVGVDVKCIAHHPCPSGITDKHGYLSVGCDLALRHLCHNTVYFLKNRQI